MNRRSILKYLGSSVVSALGFGQAGVSTVAYSKVADEIDYEAIGRAAADCKRANIRWKESGYHDDGDIYNEFIIRHIS